jgi:hypothetical protein
MCVGRECKLSEEDNRWLATMSDTAVQLWQISDRLCDI